MADQPSLHIDTDWKQQAQEEKRRLAEEEQKKAAAQKESSAGAARRPGAGRAARELPPASIATLVNTLMTQALYYLGDLAPQGSERGINLDMAKHQIDSLTVLEEKTKGNLTDEEKQTLDTALYEARMRYVSVASQYV